MTLFLYILATVAVLLLSGRVLWWLFRPVYLFFRWFLHKIHDN